MAGETLTITSQHCTYTQGYLFVQLITAESCHLILITTQTKPHRHSNPAIQEPQFSPHRWLYTMQDTVDYIEETSGAHTVHQYVFPWPDLSDTIYFTAVYSNLPREESPQAPIFAWRMPLTLLYSTLWPTDQLPPDWGTLPTDPDNQVNVTPGAIANRQVEGPFSYMEIRLDSRSAIFPANANQPFLFVLYDPIYRKINNAPASYLALEFTFTNFDKTQIRFTSIIGAANDDPCNIAPVPYLGSFDPLKPHLFCLDLYTTSPADLCGNPITVIPSPYIDTFVQILTNFAPATGPQVAAAGMHPFAIYSGTGQMQDISRRWLSLRPLLPQGPTPRLTQRK